MPVDITDLAGRKFKQINCFKYAVWALDYHMWTMILKYLSDAEVIKQIENLNNGEWVEEHGRQVSWQNLINVLGNYVSGSGAWDSGQCSMHWCKEVGGAQLLLPAHVINEYSREDRSFHPCPTFDDKYLPRTGVATWSKNGYKLGIDSAIFRSSGARHSAVNSFKRYGGSCDDWYGHRDIEPQKRDVSIDQIAVTTLLQTRRLQHDKLIASVAHRYKPGI